MIRSLQEQNKLNHVFCTETRPYNQGARLTAYELVYEKMDASLICDSMAAACMKEYKVCYSFIKLNLVNKIITSQNTALFIKEH